MTFDGGNWLEPLRQLAIAEVNAAPFLEPAKTSLVKLKAISEYEVYRYGSENFFSQTLQKK